MFPPINEGNSPDPLEENNESRGVPGLDQGENTATNMDL